MFLISVGSQPNPSSLTSKLFQNRIIPSLKTPSLLLHLNPLNKGYPNKPIKISALTTQETSILDETTRNEAKQKLGVLVKPMRRPRLVLKFIWMEKNIGIGIDQVIPGGYGTIPLSQYYFWPKKDAWGELKVMLESKPWISQKEIVVLLNQATDIINLWQQSGGDLD